MASIIKKSFFEMKAPLTASKIYLYGKSVEDLKGSVVKLDLTRSLRGKNMELRLRAKLVDSELVGEPISLQIIGSYIRKMMRKGADYVEDSFITDCKDTKVVIKPFMITRNRVSRTILRTLRNAAHQYLENYLKVRASKEIFTELMSNKIQKELSLKLKKIYPLALCEILVFKVLNEKK